MDIIETTIHCILFRLEFPALRSISEHNYQLEQTREKDLMRDQSHRAELMRWVIVYIVEQSLDPAWIAISSKPIVKV